MHVNTEYFSLSLFLYLYFDFYILKVINAYCTDLVLQPLKGWVYATNSIKLYLSFTITI